MLNHYFKLDETRHLAQSTVDQAAKDVEYSLEKTHMLVFHIVRN